MAVLRSPDGALFVSLDARTLVGRARYARLRVDTTRTSAEHAVLEFTPDGWSVQDLGSRNGSRLNGEPLPVREPRPLDLSPPGPAAVAEDGQLAVGQYRMLCLPSVDDVRLSVTHHEHQWQADAGDDATPTRDGEILEVDGRRWRLLLPNHLQGGSAETEALPTAVHPELHLWTTANGEELLRCALVIEGVRQELTVRTHLALLLTLAEQRLRDAERGSPADDQGWLSVDALYRQVPVAPHLLAMYLHRCRRQLAEAGLLFTDGVLEARGRRPHRELRIGLLRPVLHRPDDPTGD